MLRSTTSRARVISSEGERAYQWLYIIYNYIVILEDAGNYFQLHKSDHNARTYVHPIFIIINRFLKVHYIREKKKGKYEQKWNLNIFAKWTLQNENKFGSFRKKTLPLHHETRNK